jgi:hypothetical protein
MDQSAAPAPEQQNQPSEPSSVPPKRSKGLLIGLAGLGLIVAVVVGVWAYNQITLQGPLSKVLSSDSRNKTVVASAHFDSWINTSTVVFNLSDVSGESSPMDVFRVLLQFAESQKEHRYEQVVLASYGEKKFIIPGDYFQQLGQEYGSQNPMYTVRTFPQHLTDMNGAHPFPEYTGGILGVLNKELEEFNEMNKQWFLNDYIAKHK